MMMTPGEFSVCKGENGIETHQVRPGAVYSPCLLVVVVIVLLLLLCIFSMSFNGGRSKKKMTIF